MKVYRVGMRNILPLNEEWVQEINVAAKSFCGRIIFVRSKAGYSPALPCLPLSNCSAFSVPSDSTHFQRSLFAD